MDASSRITGTPRKYCANAISSHVKNPLITQGIFNFGERFEVEVICR